MFAEHGRAEGRGLSTERAHTHTKDEDDEVRRVENLRRDGHFVVIAGGEREREADLRLVGTPPRE